jgi:hypothetical protein
MRRSRVSAGEEAPGYNEEHRSCLPGHRLGGVYYWLIVNTRRFFCLWPGEEPLEDRWPWCLLQSNSIMSMVLSVLPSGFL